MCQVDTLPEADFLWNFGLSGGDMPVDQLIQEHGILAHGGIRAERTVTPQGLRRIGQRLLAHLDIIGQRLVAHLVEHVRRIHEPARLLEPNRRALRRYLLRQMNQPQMDPVAVVLQTRDVHAQRVRALAHEWEHQVVARLHRPIHHSLRNFSRLQVNHAGVLSAGVFGQVLLRFVGVDRQGALVMADFLRDRRLARRGRPHVDRGLSLLAGRSDAVQFVRDLLAQCLAFGRLDHDRVALRVLFAAQLHDLRRVVRRRRQLAHVRTAGRDGRRRRGRRYRRRMFARLPDRPDRPPWLPVLTWLGEL